MTTRSWDETTPLDSNHAGEGEERLRELRVDISERLLHLSPVGCVMKWASNIIPYGWRECNGDSLLITSFPDLYSVIAKIYGGTSSTFNLPNYQDKILRGWNHGKASGLFDPDAATRTKVSTSGSTMTAGDHVGTEQTHAYRSHTHSYYLPGTFANRQYVYNSGGAVYSTTSASKTASQYPATTHTETRPINKRVKYIIRVEGVHAIPTTLNPAPSGHVYLNTWNNLIPHDDDPMGDGAQEIRNFKVDFRERIDIMFPVGSMIYWPSSVIPTGWMECDGSPLDISSYQDLYNTIGTIWGSSGSIFLIPNLKGYFIKGASSLNYCATVEAAQLYSHSHTYTGGSGFGVANALGTSASNMTIHPTTTMNAGYYPPLPITDTRPKNIYLPIIIRVSGNS
jgi:microcystin-dependent protein